MSTNPERFREIPKEFHTLLQYAEEQRESEIHLRMEVGGGRSGALLYLIDEIEPGTGIPSNGRDYSSTIQQGILKLDSTRENSSTEIGNLRKARSHSKEFQKHMVEPWGQECKFKNHIAIFYKTIRGTLHKTSSIGGLQGTCLLRNIFKLVNTDLLFIWNAEPKSKYYRSPQKLLKNWLEKRINPKHSKIGIFLENHCNVNQNIPTFIINNRVFPNPYYYVLHENSINNNISIRAEIGHSHGDLNTENILIGFDRAARVDSIDDYHILDFSHYKRTQPLFFDNLYLELSYLIDLTKQQLIKPEDWLIVTEEFSKNETLNSSNLPSHLDGVCEIINSARTAFKEWVEYKSSHQSRSKDDLWNQYMLAAVAVGLNFCNKDMLSPLERWVAFIYSTAHLSLFLNFNKLPLPNSTHTVWLKLNQIEERIAIGEDWSIFAEDCNNFSQDYLYALVVYNGPVKLDRGGKEKGRV